MSLREARREAWDAFVEAIGDYGEAATTRMRTAAPDELVSIQGMAIAIHTLHQMLATIDKHHETLQTRKLQDEQRARSQSYPPNPNTHGGRGGGRPG